MALGGIPEGRRPHFGNRMISARTIGRMVNTPKRERKKTVVPKAPNRSEGGIDPAKATRFAEKIEATLKKLDEHLQASTYVTIADLEDIVRVVFEYDASPTLELSTLKSKMETLFNKKKNLTSSDIVTILKELQEIMRTDGFNERTIEGIDDIIRCYSNSQYVIMRGDAIRTTLSWNR